MSADAPAPTAPAESPRPGPLAVTAALLALGAAALLVARGGGAPRGAPVEPEEPVPVLGRVPAFSLEERSGRTVTDRDLRGRIWVADFIFTSCAGVCPEMSEGMRRVQAALGGDPDALCVSISVDPARDTPEVLRGYAARQGALPDRWLFLRGDLVAVHALGYEGFHLLDGKDPLLHSRHAALVDRQGRIRGYYGITETEGVERLLAAWRRVRDGTDGPEAAR
jgi:protein SCO1/2